MDDQVFYQSAIWKEARTKRSAGLGATGRIEGYEIYDNCRACVISHPHHAFDLHVGIGWLLPLRGSCTHSAIITELRRWHSITSILNTRGHKISGRRMNNQTHHVTRPRVDGGTTQHSIAKLRDTVFALATATQTAKSATYRRGRLPLRLLAESQIEHALTFGFAER